eukprot:Awhi_evm1s13475
MSFLKGAMDKVLSNDTVVDKGAEFIFKKYDKDNSGQLSAAEIEAALRECLVYLGHDADLPDDKIQMLVSKYDKDGDQSISQAEFTQLVHQASGHAKKTGGGEEEKK